MSDHRAIAATTASIKYLLQYWLAADIDGATVTVTPARPDTSSAGTTPTLSLFLYHVAPNAQLRNHDLPTRRADGSLSGRPSLVLDLHFLLTAYGGETSWHPQIVMGSALRGLHTFPLLTPELITAALLEEIGTSTTHPLIGADLARQVELIRLTPLSLNLEELTKLWSVMLQTPYALSAAWQASVVFLDAVSAPSAILPVRSVQIFALPKPIILLDAVESSLGKDEPITASSTLRLRGRGLKGDTTRVRMLGADYEPTSVTPKLITFALSTIPAEDLRAGVQGICVVHHPTDEDGDVLEYGFESNTLGFALRPEITVPATGTVAGTLTITVAPEMAANQRVVVYLYGASSFAIERTVVVAAGEDSADTVSLVPEDHDVPAGTYLVRLQVDGAQSVLQTDAGGNYIGPEVVLT